MPYKRMANHVKCYLIEVVQFCLSYVADLPRGIAASTYKESNKTSVGIAT